MFTRGKGIFSFFQFKGAIVHNATISGNTIYNMQRLLGWRNEDGIGLSCAGSAANVCDENINNGDLFSTNN